LMSVISKWLKRSSPSKTTLGNASKGACKDEYSLPGTDALYMSSLRSYVAHLGAAPNSLDGWTASKGGVNSRGAAEVSYVAPEGRVYKNKSAVAAALSLGDANLLLATKASSPLSTSSSSSARKKTISLSRVKPKEFVVPVKTSPCEYQRASKSTLAADYTDDKGYDHKSTMGDMAGFAVSCRSPSAWEDGTSRFVTDTSGSWENSLPICGNTVGFELNYKNSKLGVISGSTEVDGSDDENSDGSGEMAGFEECHSPSLQKVCTSPTQRALSPLNSELYEEHSYLAQQTALHDPASTAEDSRWGENISPSTLPLPSSISFSDNNSDGGQGGEDTIEDDEKQLFEECSSPSTLKSPKKRKRNQNVSCSGSEKPKRPLTTFMVFSASTRPLVMAEARSGGCSLSFAEIGREVGRRWALLSDHAKTNFKNPVPSESGGYPRARARRICGAKVNHICAAATIDWLQDSILPTVAQIISMETEAITADDAAYATALAEQSEGCNHSCAPAGKLMVGDVNIGKECCSSAEIPVPDTADITDSTQKKALAKNMKCRGTRSASSSDPSFEFVKIDFKPKDGKKAENEAFEFQQSSERDALDSRIFAAIRVLERTCLKPPPDGGIDQGYKYILQATSAAALNRDVEALSTSAGLLNDYCFAATVALSCS